MTKIQKQSPEEMIKKMLGIHIPAQYLEFFELFDIIDKPDCYEFIMHEKEEVLPEVLKDKAGVVLDGFCNPITILSHSFSLKKIFLVCKRRRWKLSGTTEHYSNSYDLHENGAKLTPQFVAFLKVFDRIKPMQF